MKIQTKIKKYIDQFDVIQIQDTDKTRVILKDAHSPKLYKAIRQAHGDNLPSDFIYDTFLSILEKMLEYDANSIDAFDEYRHEIVDSLVDIYNHELKQWLIDYPSADDYIVSVIGEHTGEPNSLDEVIALAQYAAIDDIYTFVIELLNK